MWLTVCTPRVATAMRTGNSWLPESKVGTEVESYALGDKQQMLALAYSASSSEVCNNKLLLPPNPGVTPTHLVRDHHRPGESSSPTSSLITMSDRKRAFEGNGDSGVAKKARRSVQFLLCEDCS